MVGKHNVAATIAFVFILASCATPELAPAKLASAPDSQSYAGSRQKGIELGDLKRTADACTDFYAFANGTWRDQNPIGWARTSS